MVILQPAKPLSAGALAAGLHARLGKRLRWFGRTAPGSSWVLLHSASPGEFVELCGLLEAGASLQWRFEADPPLDFNIHFHLGKDIRYPARADQARQANGTLAANAAQQYCWMWTHNAAAAASVRVDFERR